MSEEEEMICCICGKIIGDEKWNACDLGFTCEACSSKCPPKCHPPCPQKQ